MKYNIIEILNKNLTNNKLKKLINKKLYKIIELLEFSTNF